jgi:hypothetical protein
MRFKIFLVMTAIGLYGGCYSTTQPRPKAAGTPDNAWVLYVPFGGEFNAGMLASGFFLLDPNQHVTFTGGDKNLLNACAIITAISGVEFAVDNELAVYQLSPAVGNDDEESVTLTIGEALRHMQRNLEMLRMKIDPTLRGAPAAQDTRRVVLRYARRTASPKPLSERHKPMLVWSLSTFDVRGHIRSLLGSHGPSVEDADLSEAFRRYLNKGGVFHVLDCLVDPSCAIVWIRVPRDEATILIERGLMPM